LTLPKPLVEFGNKRMILHQIEALAAAGVTDIVLAVNYRPEIMEKYLLEVGQSPKREEAPATNPDPSQQ
jgi:mannose-1-phosphate guanylyltransferase